MDAENKQGNHHGESEDSIGDDAEDDQSDRAHKEGLSERNVGSKGKHEGWDEKNDCGEIGRVVPPMIWWMSHVSAHTTMRNGAVMDEWRRHEDGYGGNDPTFVLIGHVALLIFGFQRRN